MSQNDNPKNIDSKNILLSDQKFIQRILETTPNIIYIYDFEENRNIFSNIELAESLGYSTEEINKMGNSLYDRLLHPDDLETVNEHNEKLRNSSPGDILELEYRMMHLDGEWRCLYSRESIFSTDDDGKATQKIGIALDITKKYNIQKRALRQGKVLNAINEVFREALSCETEEEFTQSCLEIAENMIGCSFGFFGEVNPNGRFTTLSITNPGLADSSKYQRNASLKLSNIEISGLCGRVINDGNSYITNNPMAESESLGLPEGHTEINSFLGVPLKSMNKTIGMIALGNKPAGFSKDDVEVMEKLSFSIVEALKSIRAELTIAIQTKEILEVSTPVLQLWDGIVAAPLIGTLDSDRTNNFMEKLLNKIVKTNSEIALIDITGVPTIDTQTAHHLIETITAAKLLGSKIILTGVRPVIAQTLVQLGIDLTDFETQSSLSNGIKIAFQMRNLIVKHKNADSDGVS